VTSHDIDEAASMLIFDGHAASDASGKAGANGFDRLQAFSAGILQGADGCRPYTKV
jgi:hypothetical protein